MLPILNIGPLAIQAPGLIIMIGIWFGLTAIEKNSAKFNINGNTLSNLVLWSLLSMVLFARIGYIAHYSAIFAERPLSVLSPNLSLFDPLSGLSLGTVFFFVLIQRKKLHISNVLNAITTGLSVFVIFFFLSLLASGNYYGLPSSLPWSIHLWGFKRHPLQLYYVLALVFLCVWIFWLMGKPQKRHILFFEFLRWFSVIIIFLDFFRGDLGMRVGTVHVLQISAFISLLISIVFVKNFREKPVIEQGLPPSL